MLKFIFSDSISMKNRGSKSQLPGFTAEGSLMQLERIYHNSITHKSISPYIIPARPCCSQCESSYACRQCDATGNPTWCRYCFNCIRWCIDC